MAKQPEPLALSVPLPAANAFELYRRLAAAPPSFLLESGGGGARTARYSFLCSDPYLILSGKGDSYQLRTRESIETGVGDPFQLLMSLLRSSRMPRPEGLPPFFGGAIGYFGYDLVRRFEPIPTIARDDLGLPDLYFAFVDLVAAVDGADVIALQEVMRPHQGEDPVAVLAERLGLHIAFAATRFHKRGELGNAILSRWPIASVSMLDLSYSRLERRVAIAAQFQSEERVLDVVATHLALGDRTRDRKSTRLNSSHSSVSRMPSSA